MSHELDLSNTRAKNWKERQSNGLTYLTLPTGNILYRGYNPKQKLDRPQFFAFHKPFAEKYGDVRPWKTIRPLKLIEAHYPIELVECCIKNAYILATMAKKDQNNKALLAIQEHLLKEVPDLSNTMELDSALAKYICSLGMDGWIRLGEVGNTDEAMICIPFQSVKLI